MKTTVKSHLKKMDEAEWRELKLNLNMAENLRHTIEKYRLTEDDVRTRMNLDKKSYFDWVCGAREFTIKDIVRHDVMRSELASEAEQTKIELGENK